MAEELKRFETPVRSAELPALVAGDSQPRLQKLGIMVDFASLEYMVSSFGERRARRSLLDAHLVEAVHEALTGLLPRQVALDLRFWQWMAICRFPMIPWLRWWGTIPEEPYTPFEKRGIAKRFIGNESGKVSLAAFSHHSIARLYWCAETLMTSEDGYDLPRVCLEDQDLFTAIFERKLCIYPPAARACVRVLSGQDEKTHRRALVRLNHLLTTITLEALNEDQIVALLNDRQ